LKGAVIPQSFQAYLTSVTLYNLGTAKGGGFSPKEISDLPEASFPEEFFKNINETTKFLKSELDRLYKKYRLAESVENVATRETASENV